MVRVSAYVLVTILMLNTLPFSQLCKIPTLLQHFQEHQQRNHHLAFIDFLAMHYWGDDLNDDDDDRDRQLPFKNETIVYSAYYLAIHKIQLKRPSTPLIVAHCDINEPFRQDAHLASLFRPPKQTC